MTNISLRRLTNSTATALASTVSSAATSLPINNATWTTDTSQYPLLLSVGGETILAQGVTTAGTQTFTGCIRAINGITKGHPAGTMVTVADPFRPSLGHGLELVPQAVAGSSLPSDIISYNDPYTGQAVLRVTRDGADMQAVNYMGSVESSSCWSPDSNRLVVAKYVASNPSLTGLYVFDLTEMRWAALTTAWLWSYPIFDHDGTHVWYVYSNGTINGDGRHYEIRRAPVPVVLDFDAPMADTSTLMLDVRAAAAAAGAGPLEDVLVMNKNHIASPPEAIFSFHVKTAAGMRTMLTGPSGGSFITSWGFDQNANGGGGDGDSSVWAKNTGYSIRTHRAPGGPGTDQRAVWSFNPPTALYDLADGGGGESSIAHSDWTYHPATATDFHIGSWRWPATRTAGVTTYYPTKGLVFGEVHCSIDHASSTGPLSDIRVVTVEYHIGSTSRGQMYLFAAGDYDIGGVTHPEITSWTSIRDLRHLCGPRNFLNPNFVDNLSAFSTHPHFSPNGHWIAWQSTCENDLETPQSELRTHWFYPAEICGPAGGTDGVNYAHLDICLTYVGP
jgi:hypothetical protein